MCKWLPAFALILASCSGSVGDGGADSPNTGSDSGPSDLGAADSPDMADPLDTVEVDAVLDSEPADLPPDLPGDTGDVGPELPEGWSAQDRAFRVVVELAAHPDRDRVDHPVIARIAGSQGHVQPDVAVFEVVGDGENELAAGAWTGPTGGDAQVGFEAPGTTLAGQTRTFVVYYNVSETTASWSWADSAEWATRDWPADATVGISGGCCEVVREVDAATSVLRAGRRSGEATALRSLEPARLVAEGFGNAYQLETSTEGYPSTSLDSAAFDALVTSADDFQASLAAQYTFDVPVPHQTTLAYRVFRHWPFAQTVVSVEASTPTLHMSTNDWNARQLYLADGFDRMVSDTFDDDAIASRWDTGMRWLVVYDSVSGRGFGWFAEHRGVVRAENADGQTRIFDSYGYSAGGTLRLESLWMASDDKDAIIALFDAMKPGVRVSAPESRDLNIESPVDGSFAFPGDSLRVRVTTPGSAATVQASWTLPDGSELSVEMERTGAAWEAIEPLDIDGNSPVGTWVLRADSAGDARQASLEVRHPAHPHLLFSDSDLPELRARKDTTHAEIWMALTGAAESFGEPMPDPGEGRDIRSYAERLVTLALVQLMEPAGPYDDKLWDYFFTMLRYPNWTDPDNPFNNEDLTIGHFLSALAITYDWHYDALTPSERREVRARLADMADQWLGSGWIRHYPDIDWSHYGTVTNNHYWIRHGGVAAAAFVLADEIPEERRSAWVQRTEANLAVVLSVLEDDGASNEGVPYHSYGQINLFPWIDMRDRALGGDTARSVPWFERSILWDLYSIVPGGDDNYGGVANFGDGPPHHYNPPRSIQAWLASRLDNGSAQWMAENLDWPRTAALSYLWYDPSVAAVSPSSLPAWHLAENRGIFAWRSSWDDGAAYFSLKSGSYFGGHEQPDAGHFIVHKAGVPYITDLGYSYLKMAHEHNVVLVDGAGQFGENRQWMGAVDPANWASVPFALGDDSFFDVVADPAPMVDSDQLETWQREVVGLHPDVFLVRDVLRASGPVEWTWLLHSNRSDPPTSVSRTYDARSRRLENPWYDDGVGWIVRPQDAAPDMHVLDCSADAWSASIQPTIFVPEQKLDVGGYNSDFESFQLGHHLLRARTATATTSLVASWFETAIAVVPIASAEAEGVHLSRGADDVAIVLWPFGAAASAHDGVALTGAMGGVRLDAPAFFGRDVTHLEQDGVTLVDSTAPVSLFARLQHTPTADAPQRVILQAANAADLALFATVEPSAVTVNGVSSSFGWTGGVLTMTLPAGSHVVELEP